MLPLLHPLSLPWFRRLRRHQPRTLGLREVMEVLSLTEILVVVVVVEAENQEADVVGNVVGEVGEGVGITEGEEGEDVESNIRLYNFEIVPSGPAWIAFLFCASPFGCFPLHVAAYAQKGPSEDGRDIPQRVVVLSFVVPVLGPYIAPSG